MSKRGKEAAAGRPAPTARRARAASRRPADPLRTFTFWIALPTVLVYVIVCVLVLMTLRIMTDEINRVDADRGRHAVRAAIASVLHQLGEQAADEATWTEAYVKTYATLDAAWLDSTWGTAARGTAHYDTALVTDAAGRILFGESVRGPLTGNAADHYGAAPALLTLLGEEVTRSGGGAMVARLAPVGENLAAVGVAVIHGSAGQLSVPPAERRILWLARTLDAGVLAELARRFTIPVPRLVRDGSLAPGETALPLADAAGAPLGHIAWLPLRPGEAAFLNAASIASLVLLAVGLLTYTALTSFRRSVERRAEAEQRDWVGARYDASTGLLNRFGLEEEIARLIPRKRDELDVAIAYIEFEGLKDVAGSYGQQTTEALLNQLADRIDIGIGGEAQLARLGPDEFALCRTGEDAGERVRRCARIVLELVAEAIPLGDLRLKLAASIGIAACRVTRATVSEPVTMASAALQHARETGGNHIIVHDSSLEESRQKRLALQADIRRGLDAGEFDLEYQPIFDFSRQRMLGVEALLRWPRRRGGMLPPGEFIPAAEASGLIEELGLFALRKACEDLVDLPGLKLSANVSTVQFRSPTLASRIESILVATGFPPERLQLEITESFLLAQPERAKHAIEDLRSRGITIALDDFGTGFSSVGYLRQFRFDRVKLDRSLVSDIDLDPVKLALVESTMIFSFAMGLAVTAEGVERREEAAALTRLGCREFQGYLFSRPLPVESLRRLVAQPAELRESA